jgi:pimeloyl-CoA synthetase
VVVEQLLPQQVQIQLEEIQEQIQFFQQLQVQEVEEVEHKIQHLLQQV